MQINIVQLFPIQPYILKQKIDQQMFINGVTNQVDTDDMQQLTQIITQYATSRDTQTAPASAEQCLDFYRSQQVLAKTLALFVKRMNIQSQWVRDGSDQLTTIFNEGVIALYNAASAVSRDDSIPKEQQMFQVIYYLKAAAEHAMQNPGALVIEDLMFMLNAIGAVATEQLLFKEIKTEVKPVHLEPVKEHVKTTALPPIQKPAFSMPALPQFIQDSSMGKNIQQNLQSTLTNINTEKHVEDNVQNIEPQCQKEEQNIENESPSIQLDQSEPHAETQPEQQQEQQHEQPQITNDQNIEYVKKEETEDLPQMPSMDFPQMNNVELHQQAHENVEMPKFELTQIEESKPELPVKKEELPTEVDFAEIKLENMAKVLELGATVAGSYSAVASLGQKASKTMIPVLNIVAQKRNFYFCFQKAVIAFLTYKVAPQQASMLMQDINQYYSSMKLNVDPVFLQIQELVTKQMAEKAKEKPFIAAKLETMNMFLPEVPPQSLQVLPKGYQQMLASLFQSTQAALQQKTQLVNQQYVPFTQKIAQVKAFLEQSAQFTVNTPSLSKIQPDLSDKIQVIQANAGSLPAFSTQAQQIYKFLQDICVADQNNVKQYGAQKWQSQLAVQVVYAAMQQVVDTANALQKTTAGVQQLASYRQEEYQYVFQAIGLRAQPDVLAEKQLRLQPLLESAATISAAILDLFKPVLELTKLQTIEDFKQFLITSNINLEVDPQMINQNLMLIQKTLQTIQVDQKKLQELDTVLTAQYTQCAQVNTEFVTSKFKLSEPVLEQQAQKLLQFAQIVELAEQTIKSAMEKLTEAQNHAQKLGAEYGNQVQSQWPAFVNGAPMIIKLIL
ncbi:Conserved_hypothetical protein [Hexamita inflata]|uniref:Uncharacterized protein n=1 Tax=Hexamita inflata TaxID=28002 RepID=A0AA86QPS6_9EUKA|nr:Conserved hypothetical protein [Hexamita inflata]